MGSFGLGQVFLERLRHDDDLLLALKKAFKDNGYTTGFFTAIGAVKRAKIAYYEQGSQAYREIAIPEPAEILSCVGDISQLEEDTAVHAHITLSLSDGTVRGGHLLKGTVIFACEVFGVELKGEALQRGFDAVTGLKLWAYKT